MTSDFKIIGLTEILERLTPEGDGYRAWIPPTWRQGRTAYGGLTSGLSLAVALKSFADLPPLRSIQINFIGPVKDNPVFTARLLRKGRNVTSVQVEGFVDENIISLTTFIFGSARPSVLERDHPAPLAPAPETVEPFLMKDFAAMWPKFMHNFDTRLIAGSRPMIGANEGYIRVWSRMKDPASRTGIVSFLTLGDVLPPAASPIMPSPAPISSVNWMMNFTQEDMITREGWWQVETRLTAAQNGYSSQLMRFWNTEGVLVAEGLQAVAIFI